MLNTFLFISHQQVFFLPAEKFYYKLKYIDNFFIINKRIKKILTILKYVSESFITLRFTCIFIFLIKKNTLKIIPFI